jgi:hypothetical protein
MTSGETPLDLKHVPTMPANRRDEVVELTRSGLFTEDVFGQAL